MTWETYHAAATRQLPRGTEVLKARSGVEIILPCKFGHSERVAFNGMMPPQGVKKAMKARGWKFYGGKCTCAKHVEQRTKGETVTQMGDAMKAAMEKVVPIKEAPPPELKPSVSAKEAKREALRWLDESFDLVKGKYLDGMTDEKIAKEVGLSHKAIADLRAEFGYDIKTPPEVEQWRKQIDALRFDLEKFQREAATLSANMHDRLAKLEQRMAQWSEAA